MCGFVCVFFLGGISNEFKGRYRYEILTKDEILKIIDER